MATSIIVSFQISKAPGAHVGQHGNLQSLSSPEQPLDVLPAPPSWGGTLPGGLHFTPMSAINIWPPLPSEGVHKCATCVPYVPHRPLLLRKRPGNEHVRRGRREDGRGKYEKRDEGACPQVLVLGSTACYTVPRGAPRRNSGPSSWVRPDCSQEPSEALAVREKLSSTLALARYQTALCVREGPRPHRQSGGEMRLQALESHGWAHGDVTRRAQQRQFLDDYGKAENERKRISNTGLARCCGQPRTHRVGGPGTDCSLLTP